MKRSALARRGVGFWIAPLALVAVSLSLQACGGSNGCQDKEATSSETGCVQHALQFDCGVVDASFNSDTNVCTLSNCRVCPTFTPVRGGTPSPGPTNTPIPLPPNYQCDLSQTIPTPRPNTTPNATQTPGEAVCNALGVTKACGTADFSYEVDTGLCIVSSCGKCDFPDDVF